MLTHSLHNIRDGCGQEREGDGGEERGRCRGDGDGEREVDREKWRWRMRGREHIMVCKYHVSNQTAQFDFCEGGKVGVCSTDQTPTPSRSD